MLGRIRDKIIGTIQHEVNLEILINVLLVGLGDNTHIVGNCCWSLINLAKQLGDPNKDNSVLSRFYEGIANTLIKFSYW